MPLHGAAHVGHVAIDEFVSGMQPCKYRRTQKYETYVLLTVLRRAFVRAQQSGDGQR